MPSFMAIGSGVLLPGVAENRPFPILRALAYTTGLGYRTTCDRNNDIQLATMTVQISQICFRAL